MSKVVIVSIYPTPNGLAPTSRILAYAQSLSEMCDVEILNPFPTDTYDKLKPFPSVGIYNKIPYRYLNGRYKAKTTLSRAISILSGFRLISGLYKSAIYLNLQDYHSVIISTDNPFILFFFSLVTKRDKAKSVFIFDEYPTPIRHKLKPKIPNWKKILYSIVLSNIDAYISISKHLKIYFTAIVNKPTYIMPVIVDSHRFEFDSNVESIEYESYLCYMGNFELSKDNIDLLIRAFAIIEPMFPSLYLRLYGQPNKATLTKISSLIASLGLKEKVKLCGRIPSEEVPLILSNAKVLVSSQPDTTRAKGGFPTKFAEYLLTGKPALLTNVGENGMYLKHNEHCYLVDPDNVKSYADQLSFILNNYDQALVVAEQGKNYILNNYGSSKIGVNLYKFLIDIK